MSKKINTADIIEILSEELSVTKKLSDDFLKALVETIEEALLEKDTVRINGLGTFRTRWNKPRKSVDVNTGEDIIIDGYYRVVFVPEESLKDLANEPYAHLETIVLEEAPDEEEPPLTQEEIDENSDPAVAPLIQLDEQAGKIKNLLSEINAIGASVEDEALNESNVDNEPDKIIKPKSRSKAWCYIYAFLMIAIIILLISLLIDNDVFSTLKNFYEEKIATKPKTEVVDDMSEPIEDETVIEVVENATEQEEAQVDEAKADYDLFEVLTTECVKSGSRLAQISYRHYGVREFWVYIYEANRDKLDTPDYLTVGMELIIPKLDPSIGDINNPKCIEKAKLLQDLYLKK